MAPRCCIFQPFDGGPFDKRYDEVIGPAVEAADLKPYRVDRDPGATIPIEQLQEEVERSAVCLADISADNPNVWYELGFAIGRKKPVVLICTANRASFPFDIRHRRVIRYKSDSPTDFEQLKTSITQTLKAEVKKTGLKENIADYSPLKERKGLRDHEIAVLAFIMANARINNWISQLHEDMERAGFTRLATNLALDSLSHSGFITLDTSVSEATQEEGAAAYLTDLGSEWLRDNQDELLQSRLLNR